MEQEDVDALFKNMTTRDREKLAVLLTTFATADDLTNFIKVTQQIHKENDHRVWAWNVLKKTAAAIVLIAGAATALKSGWDWFQQGWTK